MKVVPTKWAARLGLARNRALEVLQDGVCITGRADRWEIPLARVAKISADRGLVWATVHVRTLDGKQHAVAGLAKEDAAAFVRSTEEVALRFQKSLWQRHAEEIRALTDLIESWRAGERYVAHHMLGPVLKQIEPIAVLCDSSWALPLDPKGELEPLRELVRKPDALRAAANERFLVVELERCAALFETIEAHPLTRAQREAVVTAEDRSLVIAGAGTGKTSVIVAKVAHLLQRQICVASDVLVLAYARDARQELDERIAKRVGQAVTTRTFHSLGLEIIASVEGVKPSLSPLAEDAVKLRKQLDEIVEELMEDPGASPALLRFFCEQFAPYRSPFQFKCWGGYYDYLRAEEIRALSGDLVKSYEECEIANFLYLNSVEFAYEPDYEHSTATRDRRQYRPDFHLPGPGIYIEHFCVDDNGEPPPFVDRQEYLDGMSWKRQLHKTHETTLIETYSHRAQAGTLLEELRRQLEKHGVSLLPRSHAETFSALRELGRVKQFSQLLATFLQHFKEGRHDLVELRSAAKKSVDSHRIATFLDVFELVQERYEELLSAAGHIDFQDMISKAADYAEAGTYQSPYTQLLVDEFQDISTGRARLLKALVTQSASHRLFCVGDDWQSIYRFAGADVALMRDFKHHFGVTREVRLDCTFRFNDRINECSSRFIQANPGQLRKTMAAFRKESGARVFLGLQADRSEDLLSDALARICGERPGASVMILGRYRHSKPDALDSVQAAYPSLSVEFRTVHRSKGLEADYVVVVDLGSGPFGFPCERTNDSVLQLVLSREDGFEHAEERRLFYVALTRARHAVYLLADLDNPSCFVKELRDGPYGVETFGSRLAVATHCPVCVEGQLGLIDGKYGPFYGCSNYAYCRNTERVCVACGQGALLRQGAAIVCSRAECRHREYMCPECGKGRRVRRDGPYGPFWGCSRFPECRFSRDLDGLIE